jgi:hypothetical protein
MSAFLDSPQLLKASLVLLEEATSRMSKRIWPATISVLGKDDISDGQSDRTKSVGRSK